jgi:GntR family transcriptional regulator/MocR family aminotransferase
VVAEHLLRHRGLAVGGDGRSVEDTVLATAGTTAAVSELAVAVLRPGDTVAVEEPGYQRAVRVLRAAGLQVLPAPVDAEGLLVHRIPAGVRAVYCTPAHQYPLGGRMGAARRVDLVRRARADGFFLIEDDYDGELRYDVAPLPMLAALAPDVVVHLGTTSKTFTATLGAGWMVAPPPVAASVLAHRQRGASPSPAGQRVLVELARHGDLGRHLRRVRRELSARRDLVVNTLRAACISTLGDDAGAHLVLPLPSAAQERQVITEASQRNLRLAGLARDHTARVSWHGIALGYSGCGRDQLAAALDVLVELIRAAS